MGCGTSTAGTEHTAVADTTQQAPSEYLLKFLVIGDCQVGKSSLLQRYTTDTFTESYIATTAVDFRLRKLELDGRSIKVRIWDTPSQEHLSTVTAAYYRNTHGILIVYNITNQESFNSIKRWLCDVEQHAAQDVVKLLVANKCDDMANRVVDYTTGQECAAEHGMMFEETSAKDGHNVDQVFMELVTEVMKRMDSQTTNPQTTLVPI